VTLATVEHVSPAKAICDYADHYDVDLIVIGTHGRTGVGHFLMGSLQADAQGRLPNDDKCGCSRRYDDLEWIVNFAISTPDSAPDGLRARRPSQSGVA
jgi:hypothetical protein